MAVVKFQAAQQRSQQGETVDPLTGGEVAIAIERLRARPTSPVGVSVEERLHHVESEVADMKKAIVGMRDDMVSLRSEMHLGERS